MAAGGRSPGGRDFTGSVRVALLSGVLVLAASCGFSGHTFPPSANGAFRSPVTIPAGAPLVTRHVTWSVEATESLREVALLVAAFREQGDDRPVDWTLPDLRLTVIPDRRQGITEPLSVLGMRKLDLTGSCASGCRGGATVVLRRVVEATDDDLHFTLEASLNAEGVFGEPFDAAVEVREDDDRQVDGLLGGPVVAMSRTVRVSRAEQDAAASLVLHVDAAALANPVEPSLVARLETRLRTLRSKGHPAARHTLVRVADAEPLFVVEDEMSVEFDWLGLCTPEQACEIPISLEAAFDPLLEDVQNRSPDDFIELEWEVEVRLDALDGRELPDDALVLRDG